MVNPLTIVCFMGGTCGDIVTAIIDETNTTIDIDGRILLPKERILLKDPNNFSNNQEKDQLILELTCKSIASHDYEYHLIRKHSIIYVGIFDMAVAVWAANRFKQLHPDTWRQFNNQTVENHATRYIEHTNMVINNKKIKVIDIKDVVTGKLINKLKEFGFDISNAAEILYSKWLKTNNLGEQ